jgi:hypothetical protein
MEFSNHMFCSSPFKKLTPVNIVLSTSSQLHRDLIGFKYCMNAVVVDWSTVQGCAAIYQRETKGWDLAQYSVP